MGGGGEQAVGALLHLSQIFITSQMNGFDNNMTLQSGRGQELLLRGISSGCALGRAGVRGLSWPCRSPAWRPGAAPWRGALGGGRLFRGGRLPRAGVRQASSPKPGDGRPGASLPPRRIGPVSHEAHPFGRRGGGGSRPPFLLWATEMHL